MKSLDELKSIYRDDLKANLKVVETARINSIMILVAQLGAILIMIILASVLELSQNAAGWLVVAIVGAVGGTIWTTFKLLKRYRNLFKARIVRPLLEAFEPDLSYHPEEHITQRVFDESRLFETIRYDLFKGEDLIKGKYQGVPIAISELSVKRKGSGKENSTTVLFHGLFMEVELPTTFEDTTVAIPNLKAQFKMSGMLGDMMMKLMEKFLPKQSGTQVHFDDPEFEEIFNVYSLKAHEAHRIFTKAMRARLVALQKISTESHSKNEVMQAGVRIAFRENKAYIAMPLPGSWFEPALHRTVKDYTIVERFIDDLRRATDVVLVVRDGLTEPADDIS